MAVRDRAKATYQRLMDDDVEGHGLPPRREPPDEPPADA